MTYEEEPNIFSETDITPEEYTEDMIKEERIAFADWLGKFSRSIDKDLLTTDDIQDKLDAKEKELRSEGNKPFKKSLEGKDK